MGIFNFRKGTGNPPRSLHVYIAEDNVLYSKQLEFFLQNAFGKRVHVQSFPVSEVIEVKLEHGHIPDVIIMDHDLSDRYTDAAQGLDSLHTIHEQFPEILLILHSAVTNDHLAETAAAEESFTFIPKGHHAFAQIEAKIAPLLEKQEVR